MRVRTFVSKCCLAAAAFLFLQLQPAQAQQAPDAAIETARYGSWTVRCVTGEQRDCQLFQQVFIQQGQNRVPFMSLILLQDRVRFQLPHGFDLAKPLRVATGSGFEREIPYRVCTQQGCFAGTEIDEAIIAALQRGDVLKVSLGRLEQEDLVFDVSLEGFTQAYNQMQEAQ